MAPTYPSFTETYHHDQYPAIDPTRPELDCSDKIILITGGGRGIGQAIAVAFAQARAKGIALLGRTQSTLDATAALVKRTNSATEVFVVTADITSPTDVHAAMDAVVAHFAAAPDVLVNNAGGIAGTGHLIDVDIEQLWKCFELNTKGPLTVTQAFLRAVRADSAAAAAASGDGNHDDDVDDKKATSPLPARTVINLPSGAAHLPYFPSGASYATSKLASAKLTEYLHFEQPHWAVFNLQPGVVDTELARAAGRSAPDSPRLPAGLAVWLTARSTTEARFLSGRFLWANWDVGELVQKADEIAARGLLQLGLKGWAEECSAEDLIARARSVQSKDKA